MATIWCCVAHCLFDDSRLRKWTSPRTRCLPHPSPSTTVACWNWCDRAIHMFTSSSGCSLSATPSCPSKRTTVYIYNNNLIYKIIFYRVLVVFLIVFRVNHSSPSQRRCRFNLLHTAITFDHFFTVSLSSKPTFSENLILHLSLFLSVGLISWLQTVHRTYLFIGFTF